MSVRKITPGNHLRGELTVPGDKSISHRAVMLGSIAQGTTEIDGVYHIERGYETLVEKLSGVGAKIQVLFLPDDEAQTQAG